MRFMLIVLFLSLSGCAYPFFDDDAYDPYNGGYYGHGSEHEGAGYYGHGGEHGDSEHEHGDD